MITTHDKLRNLPAEAAAILNRELAARVGKPVLLLFSGGSALSLLEHIDVSNIRSNVTISVLDERYDPSGRSSNFAALSQKPFYKHAIENGAASIDTRVQEDETLAALRKRFEDVLRTWRAEHPDGAVLITQGIGEDGHTAGIIGNTMKTGDFMGTFEDRDVWVAGYELLPTQSEHLKRVTTTLSFLTHEVDFSLVYVSGEKKKPVVAQVLAGTGTLSSIPALIIQSMRRVELCTDFSLR